MPREELSEVELNAIERAILCAEKSSVVEVVPIPVRQARELHTSYRAAEAMAELIDNIEKAYSRTDMPANLGSQLRRARRFLGAA